MWRANHGRQWISLGTFRGNSDSTTEQANVVDIRGCRYLRFIPISCENGGAMRIGIYGDSAKQQGTNDPMKSINPRGKHNKKWLTENSNTTNTAAAPDELLTKEYVLRHPSTLQAPNADCRDFLHYDRRQWWYEKSPHKERRQLRKDARKATRNL